MRLARFVCPGGGCLIAAGQRGRAAVASAPRLLALEIYFEKDFTNMAKTYARQSSDICRFDCRLWNVDLEYTFVQRLNVSWM